MSDTPRVGHHGPIRFGTLEAEAVVLDDGRRGFLSRQFAKLLGYHEKNQGNRFDRFLAEFAPNHMNGKMKAGSPVLNPGHGMAQFIPAEAVVEAIDNVADAAIAGGTHKQQARQVAACIAIRRAIGIVGLVALIDEATGYQYRRAPNALQELLGRLLRDRPMDWERRFHPTYYHSLMRLIGRRYTRHTPLPNIIGNITDRWVYGVVFPPEIVKEMRERRKAKATHDKLHQWLTDGGLRLLEQQIDRVTTVAAGSVNLKDFEARASQTFEVRGQVGMVFPLPHAA